jgi:hypothetical protein
VDEDRRRIDDDDNVVAHDVKRRRGFIVGVVDVEVRHLARQGSSAHPYLASQLSTEVARQSTKGYPAVADLFLEVSEIGSEMVTETQDTRFIQVQAVEMT